MKISVVTDLFKLAHSYICDKCGYSFRDNYNLDVHSKPVRLNTPIHLMENLISGNAEETVLLNYQNILMWK